MVEAKQKRRLGVWWKFNYQHLFSICTTAPSSVVRGNLPKSVEKWRTDAGEVATGSLDGLFDSHAREMNFQILSGLKN